MKRFITLCFVVAVAAPSAASAHFGDIWFDTAARTEQNIERKYTAVRAASCSAIPPALRKRFNAHSIVRNNTRLWDHFFCAVYSSHIDGACLVLAHITGREWNKLVLTSWPRDGCTTRALWG